MKRILVAGIGNIFLGDDAFGVEVVRALANRSLPKEVAVRDFGIRGYDLAFALTGGYEAGILVDALPRGEAPGTLYLLEPDLASLGYGDAASLDAHNLEPVRVLQMARKLGELPQRLYLVGCEPGALEGEEGRIELSDAVAMALPKAMELIESLANTLLGMEPRAADAARK
jgi:hydrogenase maturation protease